ncbi:MAG: response regulator [Thermodesulfobacteriota bacterium]|jgi:DNA-binding NtrC family response regulator|nr:MAG: response regulator [Thermodesulfobacteriota bacterium]
MGEKISLLLVDDERQFLETICKRLELRNFEVTPVSSGEEAIEAARKNEFEIALVDLKMPGMGGEQVLEVLKKEHKFLEVIILTGHGSIDSAVRTTKLGAYYYLQKPCELEMLLQVLEEAYQKRIQNKYGYKDEEMRKILSQMATDSSLKTLQNLKKFDTLRRTKQNPSNFFNEKNCY